ncbi:MAG: NAAT family transporter [Pontiellaceae bacterium]|nr:NAAT family transporter [Pontiellaceae bacterium]MBN2783960.1 NAAT family transporter [Pontiellaceae bacterium]
MENRFGLFVAIWLKFSFLFTPFFALTMFLSLTKGSSETERRKLSVRVSVAVAVLCIVVFFFGNVVFNLFGITLDSFRVGAGILLFLSAIQLVQSKPSPGDTAYTGDDDITVVPLAMPIVIGPAIIGTLLVLGAELPDPVSKGIGIIALMLATVTLGIILFLGASIERLVGRKNLTILSKMTGLILAALAAQMIMTGIRNFFS